MGENDIYDKRDFYKSKLAPLIKEIKLLCQDERMPMICTVAVKNDEHGTEYETEMILGAAERHLENNKIGKSAFHIAGVETKLPDYIKRDLSELSEYEQKHVAFLNEAGWTDTELSDDKISGIEGIISGNDALDLKISNAAKVSDTFWDDETEEKELKTVDAFISGSFNAEIRKFGYGYFLRDGKKEWSENGFFDPVSIETGWNIVGELKAAEYAIEKAINLGYDKIIVHHIFEGVGAWADKRWKAKRAFSRRYLVKITGFREKIQVRFIYNMLDGYEDEFKKAKKLSDQAAFVLAAERKEQN